MKRLLTLVAFFATLHASAQQVNPVPDYVFRNQMSVGRNAVTDTAAYFSIGPRYGATKGFMPPIVGDTATFSSGKRNGLLIFSVQKNKFLYWDSVRVQWSDMAGSSGSYITGSGITGYLPQFSASTTLDTSALFTLGNRLGIGTSTFAYNSTNTANIELNGTAGGILGFKRNDSARGYLWHTGDNMELANTAAGSISFNTNSATRGSISSAGVWRLHNLAGTGDRAVVASSNGTLSASTSVTGLVDTLTISTRAWRQKGLDSLAALEVSGSGTTNYVAKFSAGSTIGNSQIFDNGTNVGIGTSSPSSLLHLSTTRTSKVKISADTDNDDENDVASIELSQDGVVSTANFGIDANNDLVIGANSTTNPNIYFSTRNDGTTFASSNDAKLIITNAGESLFGTSTDYGDFRVQVSGAIYNTTSAVFAASSGNVGIGRTPTYKLDVAGGARIDTTLMLGKGLINNQRLIQFPVFDFYYLQQKTSFDGFSVDSVECEYILLKSDEGTNRQTMFIGDSFVDSKNVFGFSTSADNGASYSARLVINRDGGVGVGTNSPNASALIDLTSTTKGFLPPRMTTTQRDAISSPAAGLVIYNTTTSKLQVYTSTWTDLH